MPRTPTPAATASASRCSPATSPRRRARATARPARGRRRRVVRVPGRRLAQQMGLSDLQVERVYMAGLLHDVGKIGVPEAVLQKTGRLTPEEFAPTQHPPARRAPPLPAAPR